MTTTVRLRAFHQAAWNEPLLHEQTSPGERGFDPPATEPAIAEAVGDGVSALPASLRRSVPPALPELAQPAVLRHFLRLSQETLGQDIDIHLGLGTCTMKYSPKVNEALVRSHKVTHLHPWQDADTAQGILEAMYRLERIICEISGMERASFQPGGGTQAVYANARMIAACQTARGQGHRDEIITTVFSHPCDGAGPATAGYKLVTLYPGRDGLPELDALKAALSERTAGLMITNPEDTGIFNPQIDRFVDLVHQAGGICHYDQANANGILGITRASDAGFDLCQFNLHKTFSSPHCSMGMPVGVSAVSRELAPYLPKPTVEFDGERYFLDDERPQSIGKVRAFHGVPATIVRAYAWVLALGAEGLREVAEIAVLNNNYLAKRLEGARGLDVSYADGNAAHRLEQIRYSWQRLTEETGVTTLDLARRTNDFGVAQYFPSHEPWVVAEPMTLEPAETVSRADLDTYAAIIHRVAQEAYDDPETVRTSPHSSSVHYLDPAPMDDPARWAVTWRAWLRKHGQGAVESSSAAP
jgi:glycine dehydrogenase subunit 2